MSTSQLPKSKNNGKLMLFKAYDCNSANTLIPGWLSEMDGDNTEEDREIHLYHSELDCTISSPSLKKVFKTSPNSIQYKQQNY